MLRFVLLLALLAPAQEIPNEALEWFRKGENLIGTPQENSEQQAEYFRRAVGLAPNFAAARFNLALIYLRQQKPEQALEQLNRLVELDPDDPRAYLLRSQIYLQREQRERGAQDIARALEIEPENYDAWQVQGRIRYDQGRFEEAASSFEKALELSPNPLEAYFDLALAQQALGRTEQAIENYKKYLVHFPYDFDTNFFLGVLYREIGRDDLALNHFLEAEVQKPDDPRLAQELGNLYLDRGDLHESRKRLLRSDEHLPVNLANLGVIAKRRQDYAEAEKYFRMAVEKEPNALIWAHLGDVLAYQQKEQEAIDAYLQALQYEPEDFDTLYNLGTLYANLRENEKAIQYLERAQKVNPSNGGVYYNLALIADREGDLDQAQARYLEAVGHGVDRYEAHLRLAFLFARQKEKAKALEHLERALLKNSEMTLQLIDKELRRVQSDLDPIRYTTEFGDLLSKYRKE